MSDHSVGFVAALNDFHRARRQADLGEIIARFTGKSTALLSYEEVRQKLNAQESGARKLEDIPLDAIVGSVGRYTDFTRNFLPRQDSDAERWARVQLATTDLAGLPPIEVYQIDQAYFVLDGNHRVSIARQLGATHIQAYVTQVHSRVTLSPDVQPDDLIVKAEYADFLHYTHLDQLCPEADLTVSIPGQYARLENHIEVHRYFIETEQGRDISLEEAARHWCDDVYTPIVQLIRERGILRDFPERTETDLYLWIAEHRLTLEREMGWKIRPESAMTDLVANFSPNPRRVASRLSWQVLDAATPERLGAGPPPGQWRTEHLAARRAAQTDSSHTCLFADTLIALNGEAAGWRALEQGLIIAQQEKAWLHGLHVVPSEERKNDPAVQSLRAEFDQRCQAAGVTGQLAIQAGEVTRAVCRRSWYTDLVIVSLNYPPGAQLLARLRSGFRNLIQRCPRPVLAVPAVSSLDRALLTYDGSPKAEEALFIATYLSSRWAIPLVVVSVPEREHTASNTPARAQHYLEEHGVQATFVQEYGSVAEVILQTAKEHSSNLFIMGGYGSGPVLELMLGSTVDLVLRQSKCPVLICR